jgi:biotin synthase
MVNEEIRKIINKALDGGRIGKGELVKLLSCEDTSEEAFAIRAAGGYLMRKKTGNAGVIFGQIGIEMHPCEANCSFCSFAKDYTSMEATRLDDAAIAEATRNFTGSGDLYGLWLMTMASYDLEGYLDAVKLAKENLGGPTNIYSNVGDTSREDFEAMKEAGIDGVYHCWRLREGTDTPFSADDRKKTLENAREAGLDVLDAVEPIGPEHTPDELAEHILYDIEIGAIQTGSMKRIPVPGTPFEDKGMITDFRLATIVAAQALAVANLDAIPWLGIHEPSPIGYTCGANLITAETGFNPRDTAEDTSANRGLDIPACRDILRQAGFTQLVRGDGSRVEM